MNLFEIILSPFIFIIEQLFLASYQLTHNYGMAILLLSFAISLMLLPIFIFIEKAKKKDDAIKLKMKPLLDEIKRCYKGQERYYYVKTLNRQYNYSPTRALIPILSLLIQIPFFIAAYQFLENFEPLAGVSFLFIKNLNAPDALFGAINILPIAMTVVNLISAYFYTRNGDASERKQMLVVAGIFLVLLFKLPAGLVLYWTMNNVFSFFRLFVTNPEVFRKIENQEKNNGARFYDLKIKINKLILKYKTPFIIIAIIGILTQLNWAFQNSFNDIVIRIISALMGGLILTVLIALFVSIFNKYKSLIASINIKPSILISLLFLTSYFYISGQFYFTNVNERHSQIATLFLLLIQAIGMFYFIRMRKRTPALVSHLVSILLTFILIYQVLNSLLVIDGKEIVLTFFNVKLNITESSWSEIWSIGVLFSLITLPFYFTHNKIQLLPIAKPHWNIYLLSIFYITGLVFFWNPLIVFSSFPANFHFPAITFFTNNFALFSLSIVIGVLLYIAIPKKVRYLVLTFSISISIIVFLYSSIIPFNVGTLQSNFFSQEDRLAAKTIYYLLEAFLLLGIFTGVYWVLKKQWFKQITILLILLNTLLIVQSLFASFNTGVFFKLASKNELISNNGKPSKEIPFSKDKENIVFFIIDGAQGWYMNDIIEEDSILKDLYDGFTWYPNTLSTSNYTYSSVPSMMCGEGFTVGNMNKNEEKTIIQKITTATEIFLDKIKNKGYFYSSTGLKYSKMNTDRFDNYIPAWHEDWSKKLDLGPQSEMWYTRLWENALFSSAPLFIKSRIYNHNKWLVKDNIDMNSSELNRYNFVKILPRISNNKSDKPNFIFIHAMFTHAPWDFISDDNKLTRDVSPYKNQKWFTQEFTHWINWMKNNEVYDNTKIILVSDHGPSWWHYHNKIEADLPVVNYDKNIIPYTPFLRLNPLLLVKDFKSTGPLKEDWRLMSNADTYNIAFNENDPTKIDSSSRTVSTYYTVWHRDLNVRIKYKNQFAFEVKDYVYDLNNWIKIEE